MLICTTWTGTACVAPSFGELFGPITTETGPGAHIYSALRIFPTALHPPFKPTHPTFHSRHPNLGLMLPRWRCAPWYRYSTLAMFPHSFYRRGRRAYCVLYICYSVSPQESKCLLRLLGESLKCIDRSSPSAVEVPPLAIAGCRALIQGQVLRCQEHL